MAQFLAGGNGTLQISGGGDFVFDQRMIMVVADALSNSSVHMRTFTEAACGSMESMGASLTDTIDAFSESFASFNELVPTLRELGHQLNVAIESSTSAALFSLSALSLMLLAMGANFFMGALTNLICCCPPLGPVPESVRRRRAIRKRQRQLAKARKAAAKAKARKAATAKAPASLTRSVKIQLAVASTPPESGSLGPLRDDLGFWKGDQPASPSTPPAFVPYPRPPPPVAPRFVPPAPAPQFVPSFPPPEPPPEPEVVAPDERPEPLFPTPPRQWQRYQSDSRDAPPSGYAFSNE